MSKPKSAEQVGEVVQKLQVIMNTGLSARQWCDCVEYITRLIAETKAETLEEVAKNFSEAEIRARTSTWAECWKRLSNSIKKESTALRQSLETKEGK